MTVSFTKLNVKVSTSTKRGLGGDYDVNLLASTFLKVLFSLECLFENQSIPTDLKLVNITNSTCKHFPAVITVTASVGPQGVSESDNSIQVCVQLLQDLQLGCPVTLRLSTSDISATGKARGCNKNV